MTRYRITPDALVASLTDGAVLLNLHTKRYYSLNETGTRVWGLLEREEPTERIVAALAEAYEVEEPEARRSVLALLDELRAERLIELVEP